MEIVWDESVYMGVDGNSKKLLHGEVRKINAQRSIPPTVVGPNSKTDMYIGSIEGFENETLLRTSITTLKPEKEAVSSLDTLKNELRGMDVQVLLALKIQGQTHDYNFNFDINEVEDSKRGRR
jgi:hypothetical protein